MIASLTGILLSIIGLIYSNAIILLLGVIFIVIDFLPSKKSKTEQKAVATEVKKERHIVVNSPPPTEEGAEFFMAMQAGNPAMPHIRKMYTDKETSEVLMPHDYLPFQEPANINPLRKIFIGYPNYVLRRIFSGVNFFEDLEKRWREK
ncbi:hypothetical protein DRN74_00210 [Candidatus Micrarchaeota archaeon]|nr:MAG: hypothetical protein DRN74_00210 [Candidatus Micrarchaeota archaeon]